MKEIDQLNPDTKRAILPIGTAGRVLVGFGFLYLAIFDTPFRWGLEWHEALMGLLAFPAATILGVLLWKELNGLNSKPCPMSLRCFKDVVIGSSVLWKKMKIFICVAGSTPYLN